MRELSTTQREINDRNIGALAATTLPLPISLFFASIFGGLVWATVSLTVLLAGYGVYRFFTSEAFDENAEQYNQVISFLKGYAFDWKITEQTGRRKRLEQVRDNIYVERPFQRAEGYRYSLNEKVIILRTIAKSYHSAEGISPALDEMTIRVYNPAKAGEFTDYKPGRGYMERIDEAIKVMRTIREMNTLVGVAIDAEAKRTPLDEARQAIADYRKRNNAPELEHDPFVGPRPEPIAVEKA